MRAHAAGDAPNDDRLLLDVAAAIRANLPLLLVLDTALLLVAVPALIVVAGGAPLVAPPLAALTLGPFWAATIATTDRLWLDGDASAVTFLRSLRRYAVRGVAVALVPAGIAILLLGTLRILADQPHARWLLLPLCADGSVAVLTLLASFAAFSLATTGGLRGRTLWLAALATVARQPMTAFGGVAIIALGLVAVTVIGPLVPALLVAPFALFLSATTWHDVGRMA